MNPRVIVSFALLWVDLLVAPMDAMHANHWGHLPDQLAYFPSSSSESDDEDSDDDGYYDSFKEEWRTISANSTRRVFNFGVGSLTSYGSRQHTVDPVMPEPPPTIAPAYPDRVHGIVRELGACYHWAAASARPCFPDRDNCTVPVVGVFFEIYEEEWPRFRDRESNYDLLEITPSFPLPRGLDPDAYFFAWGNLSSSGESPQCNNKWSPWGKSVVSTAYWDYMIGGLLAWDGQLLDSGRFTWDLIAELDLLDDMASKAYQVPSIPLAERRRLAVDFVRSTKHSSNLPWVDDRKCPFSGDSNVTPLSNLSENVLATGPTAEAIGTVSPPFSKEFHDYVDAILVEGGWEHGALNSIHDRIDACQKYHGFPDRSDWTRNPYYEDIRLFSKLVAQVEV
ncbi:expressed unknown protein [Seminavis robusta]|uniref:Uncharacterized protein n=1 Tax=Seminavis robusta TaxID=568900 RepID=A0A9N8DMD1_9STRA|nr:expressed unknown protein [Seminavis robusta]|eukprot:Sro163_g073330.1 n/a (394) ;mRNA; f:78128-79309